MGYGDEPAYALETGRRVLWKMTFELQFWRRRFLRYDTLQIGGLQSCLVYASPTISRLDCLIS